MFNIVILMGLFMGISSETSHNSTLGKSVRFNSFARYLVSRVISRYFFVYYVSLLLMCIDFI